MKAQSWPTSSTVRMTPYSSLIAIAFNVSCGLAERELRKPPRMRRLGTAGTGGSDQLRGAKPSQKGGKRSKFSPWMHFSLKWYVS
jgi:hypothetical protein